MRSKAVQSPYVIRGSCSLFACRCCRTKYGWEHQPWCTHDTLTEPTCDDCRYYSAHGGVYRTKQSLQSIEEQLSRRFLRVSRFELINLSMVRRYDFTIVGTLHIEFDNGMETWASRRYIPLIKERLSEEEGYLC